MAIPSLKALEDCADWSKTVEPFLPQLYELPQKLLDSVSGSQNALELYQQTNPLVTGFAFSLFVGVVVLVVSEINRNYSQVDRLWSLLPTVYNAHFTVWSHLNGLPSQRLDLITLWSVFWSARLTFNYWRKGGYTVGSEDYRWEIVRAHVHPIIFFVLNVTFISFIQSVLLFLIAAPTYAVLLASQHEQQITTADIAFTTIQLALVVTEWFSDQQQWDYQLAKKEYQKTAKLPQGFKQEDLDRGFIASGLWAYCRHPNFTAEQTIWFVLYQWSCYASKVLYSWTGTGSFCLILLFQGSTWLTELITAGKYPEYKHYQRHVGMQIPSLTPYKTPDPKVIRTSELAKKQQAKSKQT
ncbi:hypothetical protein JX265_002452 [Neoarthrinium moseri]|uniref:DUF1295 domain protein n=1 Tax=Neoarthrinium moseri TaxID=1658444 RepID=A0A9P9WUF8_9PEZI|nr:uncharacterized protein JN550_000266 [Neoarthrinium moseri]KAI1854813.1 hypothetical protein JX266_000931 [Neoarthrinium moseri]KAI1878084.1 hypothetical protein JN550_000266 [Neoarthrinium moseri]KAI1879498.1 hypothetical protein JX265_002452 [Neoarthrinium moseri]